MKPLPVILAERRTMRAAEAERLRQPGKKPILFGSFEAHPAHIDTGHSEAWVLFAWWCELSASEVLYGMRPMTRAEYQMTYGALPALPQRAFTR